MQTTPILDNSPRERVIRQLRDMIQDGKISPGDRLPAENKLAEQMHVARGTVRAALDQLENIGLICTRKHSGRFVVDTGGQSAPGLLSSTFLLLTDIDTHPNSYAQSHRMWAVEAGIMSMGQEIGLNGMLLNSRCLHDGYLEKVLSCAPYGIIVGNTVAQQEMASVKSLLAAADIPVVINGDFEELQNFDRVDFDHEKGSEMLTDYLISRGCRKILRVWGVPDEPAWLKARSDGHVKAMTKAGLDVLPAVMINKLTLVEQNNRSVFEQRTRDYAGYLAEHLSNSDSVVDAIMLVNDNDVFPAAAACRLFGRTPGKDIQLVGYDNILAESGEQQWDDYTPPATIDKHNFETGQGAMQLLQDRRTQKLPIEPQKRLVAPELVLT